MSPHCTRHCHARFTQAGVYLANVCGTQDPSAAFGGAKSEYTRSQLEASAAAKDDFFARQMAANASKPEGLAPSQVPCTLLPP